jgi:hypothetical protein
VGQTLDFLFLLHMPLALQDQLRGIWKEKHIVFLVETLLEHAVRVAVVFREEIVVALERGQMDAHLEALQMGSVVAEDQEENA